MTATLRFNRQLAYRDSKFAWGLAWDGAQTLYGARTKDDNSLSTWAFDLANGGATQLKNPSRKASFGPALAYHGGKLYAVFRQESNSSEDKQMYFAEYGDGRWSEAEKIAKLPGGVEAGGSALAVTDHSPSTCVAGGALVVVAKTSKKHAVAECWYDISGKRWSSSSNRTEWYKVHDNLSGKRKEQVEKEKKAREEDWGYQAKPDAPKDARVTIEKNQIYTEPAEVGWNPQTPKSPSITASSDGAVHVVYKGGVYTDNEPEAIYYLAGDAQHRWQKPVRVLSPSKTEYGPAIAACGQRLVLLFANAGEDGHLYYSVRDGGAWSSPAPLLGKESKKINQPTKHSSNIVLTAAGDHRLALSLRPDGDDKSRVYLFDLAG